MEKSLSLTEYFLIAFLDIEGAFNNVVPEAITGALTNLGIESRLLGLIDQLLTCGRRSAYFYGKISPNTMRPYVGQATKTGYLG